MWLYDFILGNDYGHLSLSGVSYLHLSYIYASSKRADDCVSQYQAEHMSYYVNSLDLFNLVIKEQGSRAIHFDQLWWRAWLCAHAWEKSKTSLRDQVGSKTPIH